MIPDFFHPWYPCDPWFPAGQVTTDRTDDTDGQVCHFAGGTHSRALKAGVYIPVFRPLGLTIPGDTCGFGKM